ncbi:MAG: type I-C CRISPR-associated protein Cas8c/Csd1 [Nitrolancea sp.]
MLLRELKRYAEERMKDVPPTLYIRTPVRYIIDLSIDGRLLSTTPIDTADPASRTSRRGVPRLVPQIQRAAGIKPLLLVDKADYVLGYFLASDDQTAAERERKERRVAACHAAYLDLLERCAIATGEPTVSAVLTFLRSAPLERMSLGPDFDPGGLTVFRVDGVFPAELPTVQRFWAADNAPDANDPDTHVMQCIVCGEERPVLQRLQAKIKGVPGGQTAGTSIISANNAAFESYGLHASLIAPTCADCGEKFTLALNELLKEELSHRVLGGSVMVCWTRQDIQFDFLGSFFDPAPAQFFDLIDAFWHPKSAIPDVDETAFFAATLSGSGGRTVVRDWMDTTVGEVERRLGAWFSHQSIVTEYGEPARHLGPYALAAATVRDLKDVPATVPRIFLRAAVTGTPLPWNLLAAAVHRCRVEQRVTRQHAALIKLVLQSNEPPTEEETMVQLNPEHPSAAYQCGRVLAILEEIQRAAMPGVNATIVDRFYGTASTAPASVFSRLLRGAQPHLSKLERDRRGAYVALQGRLEEILGHLSGFPTTLSLREQGLFALGYYHQRAFDRAQARATRERQLADEPVATEAMNGSADETIVERGTDNDR